MKRVQLRLQNPLAGIIPILLFAGILAGISACKSNKQVRGNSEFLTPDTTTYVSKVSLNILFRENLTAVGAPRSWIEVPKDLCRYGIEKRRLFLKTHG